MHDEGKRLTKRNLVIFTVLVLGLAAVARVAEPLTVPPGAEPGASGLGQLLWIVAPLVAMLLLRTLGGDGWSDFGLRPNFKGNGFWWLVSVLVFPAVLTLSVLIGALSGGLELDVSVSSALAAALLTGFMIAGYQLVDRRAMMVESAPDSLEFLYLIHLNVTVFLTVAVFLGHTSWRRIRVEWTRGVWAAVAVSVGIPLAFYFIIVALKYADVTYVTAARNIGIVVSTAVGALWLREKVTAVRLAGALIVLASVVALALIKG